MLLGGWVAEYVFRVPYFEMPTDPEEIRRDPTLTVIPFFCVDAVCEVPFGSYPGNMPYEYFSDEDHLRQWLEVEMWRPSGKDSIAVGSHSHELQPPGEHGAIAGPNFMGQEEEQ